MAYSKAKLKSNGDRASPCFKPFLIGNVSDKFLLTLTLLYVSVRHIIIIIIIIIIIMYLTANGLSPDGSGYNACTLIRN
jgi:hypothetical protein